MAVYRKSIATDFTSSGGDVTYGALFLEIIDAVGLTPLSITCDEADDDKVDTEFSGTLDGTQETNFDNAIAAHTAPLATTKDCFDATVAPVVGDDFDDGYGVGSVWVNVTANTVYTCVDATVGAAVWNLAGSGTHASDHTDGTDDIQSATAAQKGLATAAQITKLDAIEASATADQTASEFELGGATELDGNKLTASMGTLTDGATVTPDADTDGTVWDLTLGGNRTIAAPLNMDSGMSVILKLIQDATGSRVPTWNSVYKWPGGSAPVLTTAANAVDVISGIWDGTNMYCSFVLDVK